jgi:hypothetical protein
MVELCTNTNECKTKNWEEKPKNRADWEKSIKDAKVQVGLQYLSRRRRKFGID